MKKIIVLGAGLVGKAIAIDLSKKFEVTSSDINEIALQNLEKLGIKTLKADLKNLTSYDELLADYDLVINALPGFMGYDALRKIISAGKNVADISFFPEDAFGLDTLAKEKGVVAVTDVGVAPGMGNIILGYHNKRMKVTDYKCFVGGLPLERTQPFEYKAPFSPVDVIEEYTRPARFVVNHSVVTKPALSDREYLNFNEIGTLEAFNTDGLRSLIFTMPNIPNMIEKTMRYPGTMDFIEKLQLAGFFSEKEIELNGQKISPLQFTSKMLIDKWKLNESDREFTVMRVIVEGEELGKPACYTYDVLDRFHEKSETFSMARTTGYTCTAVANLILDGKYNRIGISPAEFVGEDDGNLDYIFDYQKEREIFYMKTCKE